MIAAKYWATEEEKRRMHEENEPIWAFISEARHTSNLSEFFLIPSFTFLLLTSVTQSVWLGDDLNLT